MHLVTLCGTWAQDLTSQPPKLLREQPLLESSGKSSYEWETTDSKRVRLPLPSLVLSLLPLLDDILPSPVNPAFSLRLLTQFTSNCNFAANSTRLHANWTKDKTATPPGTGTTNWRLLVFRLMRSAIEPCRDTGGGGSTYVNSTEGRCLSCKSEGVLWRRPAHIKFAWCKLTRNSRRVFN